MAARILITLVLLASLAGGGYWYWLGTPQYSMRKLADSVIQHDPATFHEYVDVPSVASHAADDLLSDQVRDEGGNGLLERLLGNALVGIFKPEIVQHLTNSINNYVAKPAQTPAQTVTSTAQSEEPISLKQEIKQTVGRFLRRIGEALRPPSLKEVLKEIGITQDNYRGLTGFEIKDQVCHVGLKFQPADKPEIVVQLELQKVENHWQVKRISNLDNLAKSLAGI